MPSEIIRETRDFGGRGLKAREALYNSLSNRTKKIRFKNKRTKSK